MSVNKVILVGNLGKDPEMRMVNPETTVTEFSLATSRVYKNKQGEKVDKTEWHRCKVFGKQAEFAGQYLNKGKLIYLEGELETREWEDKDGIKRWTTEVKVEKIKMLGKKGE